MKIKCDTPFGPGLIVEKGEYHDGTKALMIIADDPFPEPLCTLTVCASTQLTMKDDMYIVKTWRENAKIAHMLLEQGIFEDTGYRIDVGYQTAECWRLIKK